MSDILNLPGPEAENWDDVTKVSVPTTVQGALMNKKLLAARVLTAENPEEEGARVGAAIAIGSQIGIAPSVVLNDIDRYYGIYSGVMTKKAPMAALQSVWNDYNVNLKAMSLNHSYGKLARMRARGADTSELEAEIAEEEKKIGAYDPYKQSWPIEFLRSTARILPSMQDQLIAGTSLQAAMGIILMSNPATLTGMLMLKALYFGGKAGIMAYTWNQITGGAYKDMLEMRDEHGNAPDPTRAAQISLLSGVFQAIPEYLSAQNFIPGGKAAAEALGKTAFAKWTTKNAVSGFFKKALFSVGGEVFQEVLQDLTQEGFKEILRQVEESHGSGVFERPEFRDIMEMLAETAVETAKGTALLALGSGAADAAVESYKNLSTKRKAKNVDLVGPEIIPEVGDILTPPPEIETTRTAAEIFREIQEFEERVNEEQQKLQEGDPSALQNLAELRSRSIELDAEFEAAKQNQQDLTARPKILDIVMRKDLRSFYDNAGPIGLDPRAVDLALVFEYARANALGMTIEELREAAGYTFESIDTTIEAARGMDPALAAELEARRDSIMGVTLDLNQSRQIVALLDTADATTVLHELSHVFFNTLDQGDKAVIAEHLGMARGEDGTWNWTYESAEKMVDEAMAHMIHGPRESALSKIYNTFKDILKRMAELVSVGRLRASPEVAEVLMRNFSLDPGGEASVSDVLRASGVFFEVGPESGSEQSPEREASPRRTAKEAFEALVERDQRTTLDHKDASAVRERMIPQMVQDIKSMLDRLHDPVVRESMDWYSTDPKKWREIITIEFAEFGDDKYFVPLLAVIAATSTRTFVASNEAEAILIMKHWIRTGELSTGLWRTSTGKEKETIYTATSKGDVGVISTYAAGTKQAKIIDLYTLWTGFGRDWHLLKDWLLAEHSGEEIARALGVESPPGDLDPEEVYYGIEYLGPKTGNLALALLGEDDRLVADIWFSRYWNRILAPKSYNDDVMGAPRGRSERSIMERVVSDVSREVAVQHGYDLSVPAIQAMLWYFEKELHAEYGNKTPTQSFSGAAVQRLTNLKDRGFLKDFSANPEREVVTFVQNEITQELVKYRAPAQVLEAPRLPHLLFERDFRAQMDNIVVNVNEDGDPLAPNGEPSRLGKYLWKLVRLPAFKAWAGDWQNDPSNAMALVDNNGEPMVLFHGTRGAFQEFSLKHSKKGEQAIFFTASPELASEFSGPQTWHKGYMDLIYHLDEISESGRTLTPEEIRHYEGSVMPVFVGSKNVSAVNWSAFLQEQEGLSSVDSSRPSPFDSMGMEALIARERSAGVDAVLIYNLEEFGMNQPQVVVFSPLDVKSIFNQGKFGVADARLLYEQDSDIMSKYYAGISMQMSEETQGVERIPTEQDQKWVGLGLAREIRNAFTSAGVEAEVGLTEGRYGGIEKSFDLEATLPGEREAIYEGTKEIFKIAGRNYQESAFFARVVNAGEDVDPVFHRPGIEVRFPAPIPRAEVDSALAKLAPHGLEYYTLVVDKSALSEDSDILGVRSIHMPEFWLDAIPTEAEVESSAVEAYNGFIDQAKSLIADGFSAEVFWSEVETRWRHEYRSRVGGDDKSGGLSPEDSRNARRGRGVIETVGARIEGTGEHAHLLRQDWTRSLSESGPRREYYQGAEPVQIRSGGKHPSAITVTHYGREGGLEKLSGDFSGTGISGAEEARLSYASNPDIKKRSYFYIDLHDVLPKPEPGLGQHVYRAVLKNMYDGAQDLDNLALIHSMDANDFESSVIEAGYDGYFNGRGVAVVLGGDVPVDYMGTRADQTREISSKLLFEESEREIPTKAQEKELIKRINAGEHVPADTLRAYAGREWADAALADRAIFMDVAIVSMDYDEFSDFAKAVSFGDPPRDEYLAQVWKDAEQYKTEDASLPSDSEADLTRHVEKLETALDAADMTMALLLQNIEDDRHEIQALINTLGSAREEALMLARERGRARVSKLQERIRLKKATETLIRNILRPPGKSISAEMQAKIMEIQENLVASFGRAEKRMRAALPSLVANEQDPAQRQILQKELDKKSLWDSPISELRELSLMIDGIRQEGAVQEALRKLEVKARREEMRTSWLQDLEGKKGAPIEDALDLGTGAAREEGRSPFYRTALWATLRMGRIAAKLGPSFTRDLWTRVNKATDQALENTRIRLQKLNALMKSLDITLDELSAPFVRGITHHEAVGIWIAMQNPDSAAAVIHGNRITDASEIAQALPKKMKALGQGLMDLFTDADFDRLAAVARDDQNIILTRVMNYFPMRRMDAVTGLALKQEMVGEFLDRTHRGKRYVWNKMLVDRIQISDKHQTPIRLNALGVAAEAITKQEHYIAFGELVKDLHNVASNKTVRAGFIQTWGREALRYVEEYINRISSPDGYAEKQVADGIFDALYRNASASVLAYSLTSFINNIPGFLLYWSEAGTFQLMKEVVHNTAAILNPQYRRSLEEFVYSRDPQARDRIIDPVRFMIASLGDTNIEKVQRAVGEAGFALLEVIDKWTIAVGWRAVWNKVYNQELRKGTDPALADKIASAAAQEATLKSQPTGRTKDLAPIYYSQGFRWFLMFSQPLNQIWNMLVADFPQHIAKRKYMKAVNILVSVAVTGALYGVLHRKRLPEKEEILTDLLSQFGEAIPIAGREVGSILVGQGRSHGYAILPAIGGIFKTAEKIMKDGTAEEKADAMVRLIIESNRITGLPSVQLRRLYRTFVDEDLMPRVDLWELIGGPPQEVE